VNVSKRSRKPSEERPPDIEIGATVRAARMRFDRRPETDVEFVGRSVEEEDSGSERINLPDEVEPGKTYRDVKVGWRAAAWVENARDEDPERDGGEDRR
jgi:hypothetical protein